MFFHIFRSLCFSFNSLTIFFRNQWLQQWMEVVVWSAQLIWNAKFPQLFHKPTWQPEISVNTTIWQPLNWITGIFKFKIISILKWFVQTCSNFLKLAQTCSNLLKLAKSFPNLLKLAQACLNFIQTCLFITRVVMC